MTQFHENTQRESRMEGQTDPIHRNFPVTTGCSTSATAVDLHLKVKNIKYDVDVSLTRNYCIAVSMQKISLIHKLILNMQQILGFHELNNHAQF